MPIEVVKPLICWLWLLFTTKIRIKMPFADMRSLVVDSLKRFRKRNFGTAQIDTAVVRYPTFYTGAIWMAANTR